MVTFQSSLQRLREGRIDTVQFVREVQTQGGGCLSLLVGVGIGLIVGLIIGWVIWPVEWQGASLRELRPEARYDYLAAVADAYVMYDSPEAQALAQQRVSALASTDLPAELSAAMAYFSQSGLPDREIRVSNLSRLAFVLGQTPPVTGDGAGAVNVLIEPEGTATTVVAPAPLEDTAPVVDTAVTPRAGWLSWLLGLLITLLVMGALFYLYLLFFVPRRRSPSPMADAALGGAPLDDAAIDAEFDGLDDATLRQRMQMSPGYNERSASASSEGAPAGIDTSWQRPRAAASPSSVGRPRAEEQDVNRSPRDEYEFEDEEFGDDDYDVQPDDLSAAPYSPSKRITNVTPASRAQQFTLSTNVQPEPADEADDDDAEFYEDDEEEVGQVPTVDSITSRPPTRENQIAPPSRPDTLGSNRASLPSLPSAVAGARPGAMARPSRGKLLEKYTAHYQVGIPAYDETHQILDPATNRYIGEIGMGVSTKNALLQNDAEQVIALEVWLFDKADDRNVGTQTRILLSEYAIDHNLEQAFLKERQDDPRPFTAQPGVSFQLESNSLLLDCKILEATYLKSGPAKGAFQSVKVEMAVLQKV
jgi:hypothetical protein